MAERFTVDEDVAGSSPVSHPTIINRGCSLFGATSILILTAIYIREQGLE